MTDSEVTTVSGKTSGVADPGLVTLDQLLELFGEETNALVFRERARVLAHEFIQSRCISETTELGVLRRAMTGAVIPEHCTAPREYLEYLNEQIIPNSTHVSSPTFIGHMTSALPCFLQELGGLLVAMNQNTVKLETAKSLSLVERQTIGMLHKLIYQMPDRFYTEHVQNAESTLGVFTSGGTVANTTALWCARNSALVACEGFGGVEIEGMPGALHHYGYTGAAIVGSALMHYSLDKAAGVLGLGTRNLLKIPVNADNRIDTELLRMKLSECREQGICVLAVVGVAGTTESGAIDPLDELADIAEEYGIHFHVDAAWGGALIFSSQYRGRLKGIERADSITIDGHKQMYTPMGTGMAIFRQPTLARAIEKQARYIVRKGSYDLGRRSLEGSRPANALYLHACLNILGRKGYEALIESGIRKVRYLYEQVQMRPEFEPIVAPQMNIMTYRYVPEWARARAKTLELSRDEQLRINSINEHLQRLQRNSGRSFVSRTTLETTKYGRNMPIVVLRSVIANPLTTEADINTILDEQLVHAKQAESFAQQAEGRGAHGHAAQS